MRVQFMLRDILQFDFTVDDAINRMINTRRTCGKNCGRCTLISRSDPWSWRWKGTFIVVVVIKCYKLGIFRGMQYSYSVLNVFDDSNMKPDNSTWHPKIKDT